jgi:hypothetical protein
MALNSLSKMNRTFKGTICLSNILNTFQTFVSVAENDSVRSTNLKILLLHCDIIK